MAREELLSRPCVEQLERVLGQDAAGKMVDWLGETLPLERDNATVTKNDLTLVIALLPLARSF